MLEPKSMDECVYFTRRRDGEGFVKCWVLKSKCPKCSKGLIGKPVNEKTGRPKVRAKEYVCSKCGHSFESKAYEDGLKACIMYECSCGKKGEMTVPFKRKNVMRLDEESGKKKAVKALVFNCAKCDKKFLVTKKMK